ncbi:LPXTG cell wall anchor domain-containing protein [Listeria booriae]|uniref:LPXTG cell wall anchor domain-containing protein n=1 Tax=Listeria booriae TaxID=1552123 RepID=A0A7X1CUR5_9LIST|nr:LPXTG cell wall anchor domain-containing protein [Listeria booriae]MBC1210500.1 LPXTG cell wall anchor domain-containing protein [Listeria booriae]MBC1228162.1 LPXTG cell wall anchor domain-containing protein [Listeria booriae]MBC1234248.1 LPXTG cell wall anchor domain-containing protein [Listeria booriae]MBC1247618.1 LPXTG cell wall anchor domain-containing protein [Listeria booriae]MBC1291646.1 LPXTG cell wall anchor domain-containing protein [Listeria booriae]
MKFFQKILLGFTVLFVAWAVFWKFGSLRVVNAVDMNALPSTGDTFPIWTIIIGGILIIAAIVLLLRKKW